MSLDPAARHPARTVLLASTLSGLLLWLTRGVFDVVGDAQTSGLGERVATLPSWAELAGLIVLALGIAGGIALASGANRRTADAGFRLQWEPGLGDAFVPLFALMLLLVPYLPWLPDWFPVVRLLAGPGRWMLWGIVLAQMGWLLFEASLAAQTRPAAPPPTRRRTPVWPLALVFLVSVTVYGTTAYRVTRTGPFPGGDEPHYLIITQSLLRDGDLRIENNHEDGDYLAYFQAELTPDYQTRGVDGEIYSIHPVGLPILIAPVFALAGYPGVVAFLVGLSALTATLLWWWVWRLAGSMGAASFAWAGVALSVPFVFNSFTIYPEIPAALCVLLAASALTPGRAAGMGGRAEARESGAPEAPGAARAPAVPLWGAGLALAVLPWLSSKYGLIAVLLSVCLAWRQRTSASRLTAVGPVAISLAVWSGFFYLIWGSPLPSAPYGGDPQMSLRTLLAGGPGLLFDQEYGITVYAPVLLLAVMGAHVLWRERHQRRLVLELGLAGLSLLLVVGAHQLWWAGSSMPGRFLYAALPLLGPPLAAGWLHSTENRSTRAVLRLLLLLSLAITLAVIVVDPARLVIQGRDGTSSLLEWLSPTWHAWQALPTFISGTPLSALGGTLVWLGLGTLGIWICRRLAPASGGVASLYATTVMCLTGVVAGVLVPLLPGAPDQPTFRPDSRVIFPLLETFDAAARPLALRYDPFSVVAPATLPPLVVGTAVPGQRTARQPREVLLNARFRLPAGEYVASFTGSEAASAVPNGTIGLQLGREGNPVSAWPFALTPGEHHEIEFVLPVDNQFVGFRVSPGFEASVAALELSPRTVVDRHQRRMTAPVISAMTYGTTMVLFHDDGVYSEPSGFWIQGGRSLRATLARLPDADGAWALQVHCGARPNVFTISTTSANRWSVQARLIPEVSRTITLPMPDDGGPLSVEFHTDQGFVPAELQPGSTDRRELGCWVSFPA